MVAKMTRFIYELSKYSILWGIGLVALLLLLAALLLLVPGVLLNILRYGLAAVLLIAALSIIFALMAGLLHMGKSEE